MSNSNTTSNAARTNPEKLSTTSTKTSTKTSTTKTRAIAICPADVNIRGQHNPNHKGYISLTTTNHPTQNKVQQHRYNVEIVIGRFLKPEEVVHHVDNNPSNNDIENLMLFANGLSHQRFHSLNSLENFTLDQETCAYSYNETQILCVVCGKQITGPDRFQHITCSRECSYKNATLNSKPSKAKLTQLIKKYSTLKSIAKELDVSAPQVNDWAINYEIDHLLIKNNYAKKCTIQEFIAAAEKCTKNVEIAKLLGVSTPTITRYWKQFGLIGNKLAYMA